MSPMESFRLQATGGVGVPTPTAPVNSFHLQATGRVGVPTPKAPVVAARYQRRITAVAPDPTGGWMGQLMDGTTKLSAQGVSPLQRDVTLEAGVHDITAVWTKAGLPPRTSAVTRVVCPP